MYIRKILSPLISGVLILAPLITHAEVVYLINPLGETDPRILIARIIKAILSILGSLSLLMLVYAGVLWITAQGDAKKVERGKHIMTWVVAGIALIAGSYVIVNALIAAFTTAA